MSSPATPTFGHPVTDFVAHARERLADMAEQPLWSLSEDQRRRTLTQATYLQAQLDALLLRLARDADSNDVGAETGATSTAVWWAHQTHLTQRDTASRMKLAKTLEHHPTVAAALAVGGILTDQARVIVEAVDAIPDDVATDIRDQARDYLLAQAAHHDATALRILGKRILDVVAPEVSEAQEAKALAEEERRAEEKARLTMADDGHGQTHGRFSVPTHIADMLRKQIQAITAPKAGGQGTSPHGMGLGFIEYIKRYPTDLLPKAGGVDATVVVTMTVETLMGGLKAAQLDTGTRISPGLARRLACEAGVIPVVLGGRSQVLDLGRRRRFHNKAQRIAMAIQHGGCFAEGCERPSAWCQAHHVDPWSQGGETSVAMGVLLCQHHHTLAHHPDYEMTFLPGGRVAFTRRE